MSLAYLEKDCFSVILCQPGGKTAVYIYTDHASGFDLPVKWFFPLSPIG
jgi:hypothetical protein